MMFIIHSTSIYICQPNFLYYSNLITKRRLISVKHCCVGKLFGFIASLIIILIRMTVNIYQYLPQQSILANTPISWIRCCAPRSILSQGDFSPKVWAKSNRIPLTAFDDGCISELNVTGLVYATFFTTGQLMIPLIFT